MPKSLGWVVGDIVSRIEDKRVIGLVTYRHYAEELMIYERFGRCGFAVSILMTDGKGRAMQDMLVEAEARARAGPYKDSGGTVRYMLLSEKGGKRSLRVIRASYRNQRELFKNVNRVRDAFYRRIMMGEGEVFIGGRKKIRR